MVPGVRIEGAPFLIDLMTDYQTMTF